VGVLLKDITDELRLFLAKIDTPLNTEILKLYFGFFHEID